MTFWRAAEAAAPRFGVELKMAGVHNAAEIEHAVITFSSEENGGLIAMPHTVTVVNHQLIIELASSTGCRYCLHSATPPLPVP